MKESEKPIIEKSVKPNTSWINTTLAVGVLAFIGSIIGELYNGYQNRSIEELKYESELILQALGSEIEKSI